MKKVLLFFAALAFAFSAMAETVTFTAPTGWSSTAGTQSYTSNGITIAASNGIGSTQYRVYKNATFTVTAATGTISNVAMTCTASGTSQYGPGCFTGATEGSYSYDGTTGTWTGNAAAFSLTASSNQVRMTEIVVTYTPGAAKAATPSLSASCVYTTASYDVTITNNETGATVYYTTDGTAPTTASTSFTGASTTIQVSGTQTVKAMAVATGKDDSFVATAKYTFAETYNSLEELVAADITAGTYVNVSFTNQEIKSIYTTSKGNRNGIFFDIQKGDNDIEIYYYDVPEAWGVGGLVSGTILAPWTQYNGTWELTPTSDWAWTNLTYTEPTKTEPTTTWKLNGVAVTTVTAVLGTTFAGPEFDTNSTGAVTFSSSNTDVATVDDAGLVSLVGAGTTTISASTAANTYYTASSASYTLNVVEPAVAAALPFEFDGGKADAAEKTGMTAVGLGSDYSAAPKLKLDGAGDYVEIFYAEAAKTVTFTVKGNGGTNADWDGQFDVLESTDGTTFTTVHSYVSGNLTSTAATITLDLNADSRYVKFVYVTKTTGNVALGNIRIAAASERELPVLAFGQESYNFYTDDEDKAVVATSSNSTGAITYALTEGDDEAFLIDETTGDIVCETAGTYTVTATIAATETHEAGTATCTVVIANRPAASSYYALVSSYTADGVTRYFAMGSEWENKALNAVEVYMANGVAVTTGSKDEISWMLDADGHVVNKAGEYITYSKGDITLTESSSSSFTEEEDDNGLYWKADTRSFIYRESSNQFKNYAVSNAGNSGYGTIAYLTDAAEGFVVPALTEGKMGTICLDRTVEVADLYGANFYTVTSATATEVTCTLETDGLLAGYPYIYVIDDMDEATTSGVADLIAVYSGDAEVTEGASNNHFYGVLEETTLTDGELYVLSSKTGQFVKCGEGWKVAANEAYLDLNSLVGTASAAAHRAPNANAANSIVISVGGGVATALDNADSVQVEKIFRNGQVVIIKNGVEYNAIGQKL